MATGEKSQAGQLGVRTTAWRGKLAPKYEWTDIPHDHRTEHGNAGGTWLAGPGKTMLPKGHGCIRQCCSEFLKEGPLSGSHLDCVCANDQQLTGTHNRVDVLRRCP